MDWLGRLACPQCRKPFGVRAVEGETYALDCQHCGETYAYYDRIARVVPSGVLRSPQYKADVDRYDEIGLAGPDRYLGFSDTFPVARAAFMREHLKEHGIRSFVNIGTGFGYLEEATVDFDVMSVDQSLKLLEHVKMRSISVKCIQAVAEMLPFADGSIGCIVSENTFQTVADRKRFLTEVVRVLVPEGQAFLSIGYRWNYPRKDQDGFNILVPIEFDNLKAHLETLGLSGRWFRWFNTRKLSWVKGIDDGDCLFITCYKQGGQRGS